MNGTTTTQGYCSQVWPDVTSSEVFRLDVVSRLKAMRTERSCICLYGSWPNQDVCIVQVEELRQSGLSASVFALTCKVHTNFIPICV